MEYKVYSEIRLTDKARELATEILNKEDILEMFLAGVLNVEESQAKEDAIKLKSVISKETEKKLYIYIKDLFELKGRGCNCNYVEENSKCKECSTTKIREKLGKNKKWQKTLKGDAKCC